MPRETATRRRPSLNNAEKRLDHSYDHRGELGKYGNVYNTDVVLWKTGQAEHEFCIFPYKVDKAKAKDSPFRRNTIFNAPFDTDEIERDDCWDHKLTVLIHGNIGVNQDAVLCPRTIKEPCPICEEKERLLKDGYDNNSDEVRACSPSKRAIYNVFVFDSKKEMEKGVQVWEAPHASIEDVLSEQYKNKRTGEKKLYTVPEENWNVWFEKKGTGLNTEYRAIEILERREEDKFNQKDLDALYDMSYPLEDIIEVKPFNEILEMMGARRGTSANRASGDDVPFDASDSRGQDSSTESRFRGGRAVRTDTVRTEPAKGSSDFEMPPEFADCFGISNQEITRCDEECPQEVWDACLKEKTRRLEESPSKGVDRSAGRGQIERGPKDEEPTTTRRRPPSRR